MTIPVTELGFTNTASNFGVSYLSQTPQQQITSDISSEDNAPVDTINIGDPLSSIFGPPTSSGGSSIENAVSSNSLLGSFLSTIANFSARAGLVILAIVIIAIGLTMIQKNSLQKVELVKQ